MRVRPEAGSDDPQVLVSDLPWQQDLFKGGNYIDAMALVRREAWEAIGGYTHIPGGWEDFDFWCGLIDAGWHEVLLPPATYTSHQLDACGKHHREERRLSRLLDVTHGLTCPKPDKPIWPDSRS